MRSKPLLSRAARSWVKPERKYPTPLAEPARATMARIDVAPVFVPKEIILRSRPYRMWVASWPCDLCGWHECQAAHENLGKAMQGKVCDSRTFSLCIPHGAHMGHHYMFDNYIDISRDAARELGAKLSAQMRERAVAAGWDMATLRRGA